MKLNELSNRRDQGLSESLVYIVRNGLDVMRAVKMRHISRGLIAEYAAESYCCIYFRIFNSKTIINNLYIRLCIIDRACDSFLLS